MCLFNVMLVHMWVKAHYEKPRLLSHCIFLNFNHVISVKDFHNVLHVMIGQNLTKSNVK
jgi:hypothetical protein